MNSENIYFVETTYNNTEVNGEERQTFGIMSKDQAEAKMRWIIQDWLNSMPSLRLCEEMHAITQDDGTEVIVPIFWWEQDGYIIRNCNIVRVTDQKTMTDGGGGWLPY